MECKKGTEKGRKLSKYKIWSKVEEINPNRRVKVNISGLNSQI